MISAIEAGLRKWRRFFSRSEWAIRLLRLSYGRSGSAGVPVQEPAGEPGLILVQIDGLSLTQFNRALNAGNVPFLKKLVRKEHYDVRPWYSGLPSNTPAVQAELMYGVKSCVPAFSFVDRRLGQAIKMFDAAYVEQFEARLKPQGRGLLTGGSSYSNIYTGGAEEAHFCFGQMGWSGIWHAVNPVIFPFLVILYLDIFVRTIALLVIEFFLAVFDFFKGALQGRVFSKELEMIWLRTLVCVVLREYIVAGACMDVIRGLPVIHMNFLGYDEQAHCRGPSSAFAHWSLQGIDDAIQRVHNVIHQTSHRHYDLWVYSDHGQEKTTPYAVKYGRTLEQAVEELFGAPVTAAFKPQTGSRESTRVRADLLKNRPRAATPVSAPAAAQNPEVTVAAMGPLGHIYVKRPLREDEIEHYARRLVSDLKVPLVMCKAGEGSVKAWTPRGTYVLPDQAAEIFGRQHPYVSEIKDDILRVCFHPDAGEFVIAGWCEGESAISFPIEFGAHAGMGPEETQGFALLPKDAPVAASGKPYVRPLDVRQAAERFLDKDAAAHSFFVPAEGGRPSLRVMTYNVHGCQGMDGCVSVDRIARVISRHRPDVIALQELDAGRGRSGGVDQAERIARKLEMQFHFHPVFRCDGEFGNAIFSRHPMSLIKTGTLPRYAHKTMYEPRGVIWVAVEFEGVRTQIFNTHLSIWPQERLRQVDALLSPEWLGHPDCKGPVTLCGDFNAVPASVEYRKICRKFNDCQKYLKGQGPYRTWSGKYPLGRIDYVFSGHEFKVNSIAVPRTGLEKMASDHLPLIVEFEVINEGIITNR